MAKIWYSVEIESDAVLADAIGSFLLDRGAPGLQTEDRGDRVVITAHFTDAGIETEADAFLDLLPEIVPGAGRPRVRWAPIEETDWAENWKSHFPPLEIGNRLFVHPPWITDIPTGRVGVELDPGMAFGTGHHGSTRGCLAALDALVTPEQSPTILDLGTGSGVLAIAAIKLGARAALAIDIDPDACEIASANTLANHVAEHVEVSTQLDHDRTGFDIVVANIFSGMLIGFANDIERRLTRTGHAIGAGLETEEAPGVIDAWSATGMTRQNEYEIEGWTTLVFQAPAGE